MALSKKPYKGCRDFFPKDKRIQNYMFEIMSQTADSFGHEPYDGPLLEEVELYMAKSGEELINEQIYSFTDRGDRHVAIRPEMTPTVARMVAQIHKEAARPIRWYSIPNVMRYERPQKGRLREHWQLNCDIFGASGKTGEAEIIQTLVKLLNNFGADESHFEILINDRSIVDSVFNKLMKVDKETSYKLYKIVDRSKKVSKEAIDKMIGELSLSTKQKEVFLKYINLSSFKEVAFFLNEYNLSQILDNLEQFVDLIKNLGLDNYLVYDPAIVRGLDYYTGIVFEVFDKHPDNRRALCGGGAYANLLQIFDEEALAGVGFGLGDVTLKDFLEVHNLLPNFDTPTCDFLVTFQDVEGLRPAMKIAQEIRNHGAKVVVSLELSKFKKVFSMAEKKGANFVVLIGEEEIKKSKVIVKNIESRDQHEFDVNDSKKIYELINK